VSVEWQTLAAKVESRLSRGKRDGIPTWTGKKVRYCKCLSQLTLIWTADGPNIEWRCKENIEMETALLLKRL
jgi:hypothetical protein